METSKIDDAPYRFGEYGPGYLLRGPRTDIGVVRLRPGDDASNHYHSQIEETFIVLEGEATMWVNCTERFTMRQGDVRRCDPGEMHYFVNESDGDFRALFIKAPYDPADGVQVPWVPGQPVPEPAPASQK
ncbi:cupin domain-containing protein [Georgenia daeguensis]|uniref:Cupin type-2 domain-containing protein n=1 Tax=Georgenia daeguensis TaxID=908355 RepID=A0ABP8EZD6_9MICO